MSEPENNAIREEHLRHRCGAVRCHSGHDHRHCSTVLRRYHVDIAVKRALGAKLGTLKEKIS